MFKNNHDSSMKNAFLLLFLCWQLQGFSQNFLIGLKFSGHTIHPKHEQNAPLYKWKVDKKGHLVINGGITLTADIKIYEWFGLKLSQSFIKYDCAGKHAYVSHIGANFGGHGTTIGDSNHGISGSMGPMIFFRENWKDLPGYVHDENVFGPATDKNGQPNSCSLAGSLNTIIFSTSTKVYL
jgi:hypothetical protein